MLRSADLVYQTAAPIIAAILFPLCLIAELVFKWASRPSAKFNCQGKITVITGASSGIGEAVAYEYARQGAKLVLCARRKAELDAVKMKCEGLGAQSVEACVVDVTQEDAFKATIQKIGDQFGCIDILVLNAGISMGETASFFKDTQAFHKLMDVNYFGFVSGVIYGLPFLKKSTNPKLVAVSSILGLFGGPLRTGYCATKFAMKGFLDALRLEEPDIDITLIYPGAVVTGINESRIGEQGNLDFSKKGIMTATEAASIIFDAVAAGEKDLVMTLQAKVLYYLKDLFPSVRDYIVASEWKKMVKAKK